MIFYGFFYRQTIIYMKDQISVQNRTKIQVTYQQISQKVRLLYFGSLRIMQKLQISYVTWNRTDANGLFDYEELKDKQPDESLIVESFGWIFRCKQNFSLKFSKTDINPINYEKILSIGKVDARYFMTTLNIENEPLFKIIGSEIPKTHLINKSDKLRLGKVSFEVLELEFKTKKRISSYELIKREIQRTKLNYVRQITPSFYGQQQVKRSKQQQDSKQAKELLQSEYEQNPTCRYCYSKTVTQQNPFLVSCSCIGSSRYIHEKCLLQWVVKRGRLQQSNKKGILYAQQKIFKCELCHSFFYIPQMWRKLFEYQKHVMKNLQGEVFQEVLILHVKYQTNWLYFIDLSKKREVTIGRGLDSEIILNQLSVSRQHAKLIIDSDQKTVTLSNNSAKFGTLVEIKRVEIQNQESYQVGRTKMNFRKHEKKSFFQKLGIFCFVEEKLKKQKPKFSSQVPPQNMRIYPLGDERNP